LSFTNDEIVIHIWLIINLLFWKVMKIDGTPPNFSSFLFYKGASVIVYSACQAKFIVS